MDSQWESQEVKVPILIAQREIRFLARLWQCRWKLKEMWEQGAHTLFEATVFKSPNGSKSTRNRKSFNKEEDLPKLRFQSLRQTPTTHNAAHNAKRETAEIPVPSSLLASPILPKTVPGTTPTPQVSSTWTADFSMKLDW